MTKVYTIAIISVVTALQTNQQVQAQRSDTITLSLQKTLILANDSSLSAFRAKNMYLANYWEYRTYKAGRLPKLQLQLTPIKYNRDFTQRYDFEQNIDIFRQQQTIFSHGNISLQQNFDPLGGTFYVDTELGYIRNITERVVDQFSSTPIRIGYHQNLIGFNNFRWERKIEPIKFEKSKKELAFQLENTSEVAVSYFFELAMAQVEHSLAYENKRNTDTLYSIGLERQQIASISQTDLISLRLDQVNANNRLRNTEVQLARAMSTLANFLNLDKQTKIKLDLPLTYPSFSISIEDALVLAKKNSSELLSSQVKILQSTKDAERTKKELLFNANLSLSVGFNQVAESFRMAYQNPLQQDVVSLTLSVPILDWGIRKGRYNMARNNLAIEQLSARQVEGKLEEEVMITVGDFLSQRELIKSSKEAVELAQMAYDQTQERFIIGKADINSLILSNNRHQDAQRNYITSLKAYWQNYYRIRKLTLYDFEHNHPIDIDLMIEGLEQY